MASKLMNRYAKVTVGCLMAALLAAPAFGQSTTPPGSGPTPSNTPGMSPSTAPNTRQPTDQGRSDMKGQRPKGSDMSQGSSTQGTGSTQSTGSAQDSSSQGKGHKASNSQVREVQEALKAQGHDPGPIDGVMGPQTQQAIREYQRSQNLSETGRLDAQTAQKLGVGGGMSGGGSTGSGSTGSGSSGSTTGSGSSGSSQGTGSRGTGSGSR